MKKPFLYAFTLCMSMSCVFALSATQVDCGNSEQPCSQCSQVEAPTPLAMEATCDNPDQPCSQVGAPTLLAMEATCDNPDQPCSQACSQGAPSLLACEEVDCGQDGEVHILPYPPIA